MSQHYQSTTTSNHSIWAVLLAAVGAAAIAVIVTVLALDLVGHGSSSPAAVTPTPSTPAAVTPSPSAVTPSASVKTLQQQLG
jgi:pimeloyl-ACP methyl ester carboxylesterase